MKQLVTSLPYVALISRGEAKNGGGLAFRVAWSLIFVSCEVAYRLD